MNKLRLVFTTNVLDAASRVTTESTRFGFHGTGRYALGPVGNERDPLFPRFEGVAAAHQIQLLILLTGTKTVDWLRISNHLLANKAV